MAPHDHPGQPVTTAAASLVLRGVHKTFGAAPAVDGVSLEVAPGSMLGLLGPSGCGKTTVLRMIAGLTPVTAGTITIDGADVTARPPHQRDIGLVFQHYALFPHMSAAANVAFGLEMRRVPPAETRTRVAEALELVRLPDLGARLPGQLSGGQQQRVALARALVIRPRILLLDEPLSNLDARLRDELRVEIRDIQQRLAITTVFVTHDQAEALAMCDTVGVMSRGRLAQIGSPRQVYDRPASRAVAEFVGRLNTLPCHVAGPGRLRLAGHDVAAETPDEAAGAVLATIRPHRVHLSAPGVAVPAEASRVPGRVTRVTFVGDLVHYDVAVGDATLRAERPSSAGEAAWRAGDEVVCWWAPGDVRVFRD
ncbi:MAG: ABC transporter ATP-binding protein [Vicinamibacterales bacterium]